jgi:hypothetical protein
MALPHLSSAVLLTMSSIRNRRAPLSYILRVSLSEVQFKDREIMHRLVQDFLDAPARASVLMRPVFTAEDGFKSGNIQQVASSID